MRVTNKTTAMEFINRYHSLDINLKDIKYFKSFSENLNKHFTIIVLKNDIEYSFRLVQQHNGCLWSCLDKYVFDKEKYFYVLYTDVMYFDINGYLIYDSYDTFRTLNNCTDRSQYER